MIIQTHRAPVKVVPSCCSLAQTTRGIASTDLDPDVVGAQITEQLAVGLRKTIDFRSHIPESQIIDVQFQDIVADPMGVTTDDIPADIVEREKRLASEAAADPSYVSAFVSSRWEQTVGARSFTSSGTT